MSQLIRNTKHNSFLRRYFVPEVLIVVLLFSVELTAYLDVLLPRSVSQSILFGVVMAAMFIYARTHRPRLAMKNPFWIFLWIYELFLFLRLYVDFVLQNKGFFLYQSPIAIMIFFVCTIFIPSVFFCFYTVRFDVLAIVRLLSVIVAVCVSKSIYDIISGNAILHPDGRFITAIFSIALGQYSVSLFLIGVYLLSLKVSKPLENVWPILCVLIGLAGVAFSGSRGPIIALAVCFIALIIANSKKISSTLIALSIILFILIFAKGAMIDLNEWMMDNGFFAFNRVVKSVFAEDGLANHSSGRDELYEEAIRLFLDNPFFGNSFLIPNKIYVHNFLIEQFMATGMFGGLIFCGINIYALIIGFRLMRSDKTFAIIPVLLLQYFIYGCLSITVIALFPYWITLLMTVNRYSAVNSRKLIIR